MHKPAQDLFTTGGKRRRINTSQAEVSRLYDKNKNSYSKKFKMKMELLNDPQRSLNRSLENTLSRSKKLGKSGSSKSKPTESPRENEREKDLSKERSREKQSELKATTLKPIPDDRLTSLKKTHNKTKTEEAPATLNESLMMNRAANDSTFIKIEGQENYLETVQTKEALNEQYKQIVKQIQKVKETCENEQRKVKNAEENLKAKKKILGEQKKGVRIQQRIPQDTYHAERQLRTAKQEIFVMVEQHQRKMADLRHTLQQINQMKQAQMAKLETIDRLKAEQRANTEREREYELEREQRKEEETALLRQKSALEQENKQLMTNLRRLKEVTAPPLDLHRKHIERLEKLAMNSDIERVESYLRAKEEAKSDKKSQQRLKEQISKRKDELKQLKGKLQDKKDMSEKLRKTMTDKALIVLDLGQKIRQHDTRAR